MKQDKLVKQLERASELAKKAQLVEKPEPNYDDYSSVELQQSHEFDKDQLVGGKCSDDAWRSGEESERSPLVFGKLVSVHYL